MTSDMPEVIWAKLDEDLKGTKFGPWSDPVDGYYGIDSGTRYRRGDIVDDLTKQLAECEAELVQANALLRRFVVKDELHDSQTQWEIDVMHYVRDLGDPA